MSQVKPNAFISTVSWQYHQWLLHKVNHILSPVIREMNKIFLEPTVWSMTSPSESQILSTVASEMSQRAPSWISHANQRLRHKSVTYYLQPIPKWIRGTLQFEAHAMINDFYISHSHTIPMHSRTQYTSWSARMVLLCLAMFGYIAVSPMKKSTFFRNKIWPGSWKVDILYLVSTDRSTSEI